MKSINEHLNEALNRVDEEISSSVASKLSKEFDKVEKYINSSAYKKEMPMMYEDADISYDDYDDYADDIKKAFLYIINQMRQALEYFEESEEKIKNEKDFFEEFQAQSEIDREEWWDAADVDNLAKDVAGYLINDIYMKVNRRNINVSLSYN